MSEKIFGLEWPFKHAATFPFFLCIYIINSKVMSSVVDEKATRLIDSIGYLVSSCPYQACSLEEYYRKMSSQVRYFLSLSLLFGPIHSLASKEFLFCNAPPLKAPSKVDVTQLYQDFQNIVY